MIQRKTSLKHRVSAVPGAELPLARNVSADVARRLVKMARATPGWVFTPFDFLDLGSPRSVGMALTRLTRRRVAPLGARSLRRAAHPPRAGRTATYRR